MDSDSPMRSEADRQVPDIPTETTIEPPQGFTENESGGTVMADVTVMPDRPVVAAATRQPAAMWIGAAAELAGTFMICSMIYLVYSLCGAVLGLNVILVALTTVLVYAGVTAMLGKVSGGHFNPAVTVAAMFTSQTGWLEGLVYIVAQMIGAIAAGGVLAILPTSSSVPAETWLAFSVNGFGKASPSSPYLAKSGLTFGVSMAVVTELMACLLVVGTAVATMRRNGRPRHGHALYMGLAYGAGVFLTYLVTGSGLNPARSTGVAVFAHFKKSSVDPLGQLWIFWICPLLAAAIVGLFCIIADMLKESARSAASDPLQGSVGFSEEPDGSDQVFDQDAQEGEGDPRVDPAEGAAGESTTVEGYQSQGIHGRHAA